MENFDLRENEKIIILRCLEYHKGNRNDSAKALGISTKCLRNKLIRWDMRGYLRYQFKIPDNPSDKPPEISKQRKEYLKGRSKRTSKETKEPRE